MLSHTTKVSLHSCGSQCLALRQKSPGLSLPGNGFLTMRQSLQEQRFEYCRIWCPGRMLSFVWREQVNSRTWKLQCLQIALNIQTVVLVLLLSCIILGYVTLALLIPLFHPHFLELAKENNDTGWWQRLCTIMCLGWRGHSVQKSI